MAQAELRQGAVPRPVPARPDRPVAAARPGATRQAARSSWPSCATFVRDRRRRRADRARRPHPRRGVPRASRELGAFGMKIDQKYGGLGLSNLRLLQGADAGRLGQPGDRRAAVGAPVDRRAAAAEAVRHRRAEADVPAAAGRAARSPRSCSPSPTSAPTRPGCGTTAEPGRGRLHAQRREAVGHQRHRRRPARGDGAGAQVRGAPGRHHRVRGRGRLAGASPSSGATRSWACAAWRTASPASTTCACRPRT